MRLFNLDVAESERNYQEKLHDEFEPEPGEGTDESGVCRSFFDLRQRTLTGMDQMPAFRVVALGLLRKMRFNTRGSILYSELEDSLGRYFRLLDTEMQRFANLHETLRDAADKIPPPPPRSPPLPPAAAAANALGAARLTEGMRAIAVVLLACSEMQRRSLDLKIAAQRSISDSRDGGQPAASFMKFAEFLEEGLGMCDQLRRKHQELQQQRMSAMGSLAEARVASGQSAGSSKTTPAASPTASPRPNR